MSKCIIEIIEYDNGQEVYYYEMTHESVCVCHKTIMAIIDWLKVKGWTFEDWYDEEFNDIEKDYKSKFEWFIATKKGDDKKYKTLINTKW